MKDDGVMYVLDGGNMMRCIFVLMRCNAPPLFTDVHVYVVTSSRRSFPPNFCDENISELT